MNTLVDFSPSNANNLQLSESQKSHVSQAIELLEPEIERLKALLDAHKMHLKRLRASQAPVKRLSPEILSEIFGSLLKDYSGAYRAGASDDSTILTVPYVWSYVPWLARQVCSRWRQIAMGDKRLWSHLRLVNPPFGSQPWRTNPTRAWSQLIDFAITFIPENGPVHVAIDFSTVTPEDEDPDMPSEGYSDCIRSSIQTLLRPIHHRLKTLDVSCDMEGILSYLTDDHISDSLPSLEHLTLNCIQPSDCSLGAILSRATSLRTLRVVENCYRSKMPIIEASFLKRIHWDPLQELTLTYFLTPSLTLTDLLHCLSRCLSLTHLTLVIFDRRLGLRKSLGEDENSMDYLFPSLTHFYLSLRESDLKIYQHLTCPRLRLHCFSYGIEYGNLLTDLMTFIQRSNCELRTLVDNTEDTYMPLEKGDSFLRAFLALLSPTIEELYMELPLDEATCRQIEDGSLLPRLRAISNSDAPVEVLRKRLGWLDPSVHNYEGIRKIRTPHSWSHYMPVPDNKEILEELAKTCKGLEVQFGPKRLGSGTLDWTDTSI